MTDQHTKPARDSVGRDASTNLTVVSATQAALPAVPLATRQKMLESKVDMETHRQWLSSTNVFHAVELDQANDPVALTGAVRIAFWNLERCKYVLPTVARLAGVGADVNLLTEMDLGMARSAQRHTTRDVAAGLGQGYCYGAEFVELGLGDSNERQAHADEQNASGVHGNAILSKATLKRPVILRQDTSGHWFGDANDQRRVGGRMSMAATIAIDDVDTVFVSTHFESHSDPEDRAAEMATLLGLIERYAGDAPVVLAGDFNTSSALRDNAVDGEVDRRLTAEDPDRWANPVPHEPMFEVAAAAGFDRQHCNAAGFTQRQHVPPLRERKLDWFFTRSVVARDPVIVSATDENGRTLSDHDMLCVTITPDAG